MIWILHKVWTHRNEIVLAVQVLAALRKTARDVAQEYIRRKIRTKLKGQLAIVGLQTALLAGALILNANNPGLPAELFASLVLWAITLYNLSQLAFSTIPELSALQRTLKGKIGYALKYILEVSIVTELMQMNVLFLALCLGFGISSRTWVGAAFSYTEPWVELVSPRPEPEPSSTKSRRPPKPKPRSRASSESF